MIRISVSELQTNLGKYVTMAQDQDILITRNGKQIARLTAEKPDKVAAAKALFGILPSDANTDLASEERLK